MSIHIIYSRAYREIRKIDEEIEIQAISSQLHPRFFKFYSLKQIATRKRAYATRHYDNSLGPIYLQLQTGTPEVCYLFYLDPVFKKSGNMDTNTFTLLSRITFGRRNQQ